jgi:phosphate acetyltransferase
VLTRGSAAPDLEELTRPLEGATPPVVAVVQPITQASLSGILEAVDRGFARALLVGDSEQIQAQLRACGRDPLDFAILSAASDRDAAARAVDVVRSGRAEILMKGNLHTDDFLRPVLDAERGLRGPGRMSHAFLCFLPKSAYHKPLLVTDAAMNVAPDAREKAEIVRNAIGLLHRLGVTRPKVAMLAAVESVDPAMPATLDAREVAQRAENGKFGNAIVEGPLAFDNAISAEAAALKGISTEVAGDPDVLCVPRIEAGNILYKSMVYLCGAIAAGIVLGARAPILLTSRAEPPLARTVSCAIAARIIRSGESHAEHP